MGGNFKISPWDSLLFGESSKRKYDLDQNVVKEYLQLENLREACFGLPELFDLQPADY
jgi:peptidyl-dipeptidase Dcp